MCLTKVSGHCDRCGSSSRSFKGSYFNKDMCCDSCISKERKHPSYQRAVITENEEVRRGNLNFEGIGLPSDLVVSESEKQANLAMVV